jgi:hypothetical protein
LKDEIERKETSTKVLRIKLKKFKNKDRNEKQSMREIVIEWLN